MAVATRWTEEQVKILNDTVKKAATAKEGIEIAAAMLGKSTGTVQQKYYALRRAAGKGKSRKRRAAPTPATAPRPVRAEVAPHASTRTLASTAFSSMSNVQLTQLVQEATTELVSRMRTLETNVKKLLG